MAKLINIGFGNAVNADKIQCVVNPDAAPIKRMVQHAREEDRVVDATQGRKTKSVIVWFFRPCSRIRSPSVAMI